MGSSREKEFLIILGNTKTEITMKGAYTPYIKQTRGSIAIGRCVVCTNETWCFFLATFS